MSIWPCVLAHCNIVKHALGWIEGGLCTSYEKIILDAEMLQMIAAFLEPLATDADALALDAIREVGPGSHFFQAAHTLARYERAFYAAPVRLAQLRDLAGGRRARRHAARQPPVEGAAGGLRAPPLDPAIAEEIEAFVAGRKEEGGAPEHLTRGLAKALS